MDQHRWMYVLVVVILLLYSRIYSASPHEELFIQKDILYISGSKDAFHARYHASPVTTIVSPKASLCCCVFANSFPRNSSLFRLKFFEQLTFQRFSHGRSIDNYIFRLPSTR